LVLKGLATKGVSVVLFWNSHFLSQCKRAIIHGNEKHSLPNFNLTCVFVFQWIVHNRVAAH
jgi:hypothetical protein